MKKEERIAAVFEELKGSFDLAEPADGHRQRFLEKLQLQHRAENPKPVRRLYWWQPMAVAASVALLVLLGVKFLTPDPTIDEQVAKISPEISQTEFYFASLIEEQVRILENESNPQTQQLVNDTLLQLEKLEKSYQLLELDLLKGGNSQLILSAMITNFQTRIDLLKEVLEKIEEIKNLKSIDNENYVI